MLNIVPITKQEAHALLEQWNMPYAKFSRPLFTLACAEGNAITGVAVVGLPRAYVCDDGWTAEVLLFTRDEEAKKLMTDAAWQGAQAIGYKRMLVECDAVLTVSGYTRSLCRPKVEAQKRERKMNWQSAMGGYRHER